MCFRCVIPETLAVCFAIFVTEYFRYIINRFQTKCSVKRFFHFSKLIVPIYSTNSCLSHSRRIVVNEGFLQGSKPLDPVPMETDGGRKKGQTGGRGWRRGGTVGRPAAEGLWFGY